MEELEDLVEFCRVGCSSVEIACEIEPERRETASLEKLNVLLFSLKEI